MKLKIVVLSCVLFNLFGGAYSLETDLAFHTELIPVGPKINAHAVWDTIREKVRNPGYRFKDLAGPRTKEASAWVDGNIGDGEVDVIFFFFPSALPMELSDGVLQRFLDDGNMVVTYGAFTQHTPVELKQFARNNKPLWAAAESEITPAGNRFTPSLKDVSLLIGLIGIGNKTFDLKGLALDWHFEVAFSRAVKNGFVGNAVFRNRLTNGRIALFFAHGPLDFFVIDPAPELARAEGTVLSEFLVNWLPRIAAVRPQDRLATTWGHLKRE